MISNSLVNVIHLLLYMESCCFVTITRELRDKSDRLNVNNCNGISNSFLEQGRCRCNSERSSISSTNAGHIASILDDRIDKSKYT